MPFKALKAVVTVTCGVLPGVVMPEHAEQWLYTSEDFEADKLVPQDQKTKFSIMLDVAHEHAKGLSNPAHLNWVRVDWMWM